LENSYPFRHRELVVFFHVHAGAHQIARRHVGKLAEITDQVLDRSST
jgi:hypothetical protein